MSNGNPQTWKKRNPGWKARSIPRRARMSDAEMHAALGRVTTADERWPDGVECRGKRWRYDLIWQAWVQMRG